MQLRNSSDELLKSVFGFPGFRPGQEEIIDRLLAITRSKNITRVERDLITKADGVTTIENDLIDMKASLQLADFQLEAALETYKEMESRTAWDDYGIYKPFFENFGECVYCRNVVDTLEDFNIKNIVIKIHKK